MLSSAVASRVGQSPEWNELEIHIKNEVDSLSVIDGINFLDKESAAIEGRARQLAREKLVKILEPFYTSSQPPIDKFEITNRKVGL